jgi:hypothetical protein
MTAMVMLEGTPPIPVLYTDWTEWRAFQAQPAESAPLAPATGCFCPTCWAQGRVFEEAPNGEGLVPRTCEDCAGSGWIS